MGVFTLRYISDDERSIIVAVRATLELLSECAVRISDNHSLNYCFDVACIAASPSLSSYFSNSQLTAN